METALIIFLIVVAAVAFGVGLFFGIIRLLRQSSGWDSLAALYSYQGPEPSSIWPRQTLFVGKVRYKNCVNFSALSEGMYIQTRFTPNALLIPWISFTSCRKTSLMWQEAFTLNIGNPAVGSITLLEPLFGAARNYLRHICQP